MLMNALLGHVAHILPVNADAALCYVIEPGNQLAQGALAAAGGTHNGNGFTGLHLQIDMVQDCQIALICKGHIPDGNFALYMFQRRRIRRILHRRLGAHDFHKPIQPRKAVGKQLREVRQLPHGVYKGCNIQTEGNEVPVVHLSFQNHIAAQGDDHHIEDGKEKFHRAVKQCHSLVELPFGGLELVVGRIEARLLHGFIGKCLGSADAGEAGFNFRIDVGHLLLHAHGHPAHALTHGKHHRQEHGNHQCHHQRQLPADGCHHSQRAHDGHGRGQQVLRAVVGKLGEFKQVGGQSAHELTGTVPVIKIEAHFLQMPE